MNAIGKVFSAMDEWTSFSFESLHLIRELNNFPMLALFLIRLFLIGLALEVGRAMSWRRFIEYELLDDGWALRELWAVDWPDR